MAVACWTKRLEMHVVWPLCIFILSCSLLWRNSSRKGQFTWRWCCVWLFILTLCPRLRLSPTPNVVFPQPGGGDGREHGSRGPGLWRKSLAEPLERAAWALKSDNARVKCPSLPSLLLFCKQLTADFAFSKWKRETGFQMTNGLHKRTAQASTVSRFCVGWSRWIVSARRISPVLLQSREWWFHLTSSLRHPPQVSPENQLCLFWFMYRQLLQRGENGKELVLVVLKIHPAVLYNPFKKNKLLIWTQMKLPYIESETL